MPLTSGTGLEWSPVVTGDGQTVAFLQSTAQRPPLPAVMPIAGGPPRSVGAERLRASFPSARLVTPEPVTFTASDGVEIHGQIFKTAGGEARRPALVYVHGGPPRQMLLGFHYMDYYANDYAANQYLASRGFHRPRRELPARHRLRPRVSFSGARRRARRVRVSRRAGRRQSTCSRETMWT